jgi:hypothetical protein
MKLPDEKICSKGAVVKQPGVRSSIVGLNGRIGNWNRNQLILTAELCDEKEQIEEKEPFINGEHNQENKDSPPDEVELDPHEREGYRTNTEIGQPK